MSDSFIADVDTKLRELQAQIDELKIARKWYLAMHNTAPKSGETGTAEAPRVPRADSPNTVTSRVVAFIAERLSDGHPRQTIDLFDELKAAGISIGGKSPRVGLSAILSRRKDIFSSDRKRGWALVRSAKMKEPVVASTATGSGRRRIRRSTKLPNQGSPHVAGD